MGAKGEREKKGGREAGRVGYSGMERGVGGGEGVEPATGTQHQAPGKPCSYP